VEFDGIQLKEGLKPTLFDIKAVNFREMRLYYRPCARLPQVTERRPGRLPAPAATAS
jgi:hypothetical protein